jgi:hypothetical protein
MNSTIDMHDTAGGWTIQNKPNFINPQHMKEEVLRNQAASVKASIPSFLFSFLLSLDGGLAVDETTDFAMPQSLCYG